MIPCLASDREEILASPGIFERLTEAGFRGEIATGASVRAVYSTDNSIYQVMPQGVLFPRGIEDLEVLARILSEPAFGDVSIAMRGGGTGTNGQSLTKSLVVDCSRHMTRILEIDPIRRVARVEAGVVKDQLNAALKPYGLFFAPELSTSNRATIGGMVSTDACGQGSCLYGKTSNHVIGLRVVMADGYTLWSRPVDEGGLQALKAMPGLIGEACRVADRVERSHRELIAQTFPKLNRFMTGYDLAHLRREDGRFDLNALLCGSEGTLAMLAEAELNLLPIPPYAALVNIRYADFNGALEDARNLVALSVASVETIDEKVLGLARADGGWPAIARFFPIEASGAANGINIVEVLADDQEELSRKIAAVESGLLASPCEARGGHTIARHGGDIDAIWAMRKRAVGLLGGAEGSARPVAFVEDTAVPPENLAAYIREFRELLDAEGLEYGMFGHVDAGVLHVRPALDLTRPQHVSLVRRVSDAVVALTRKHGGILWGEHGKGLRSEYVPAYFGDLYPALQEIKRAFDPRNQMNPGKICTPGDDSLAKIDSAPLRGDFDRTIAQGIRGAYDNAANCNGNGACFDYDATSVMCPSYKGTRDRRFSPKGRASLMREWLRLLAVQGVDPLDEAKRHRATNGLGRLAVRAWNTINPANRSDFSHEVRESMDTCLACKACAGQCPVKVSVPAFRAKFLELYYGRYLRPLKDPVVAAIETTLPMVAPFKPLYNALVRSTPGKFATHLIGLTALPSMPSVRLKRSLKQRGCAIATRERLLALPAGDRSRAVVFVADAFTKHFDPQIVLDIVDLASSMGFLPFLSAPLPNGKAMHVHGYLAAFEKAATRTARYLQGLEETGATLVGIDPSMTLTYRGEYASLGSIPPRVLLPQEWLVDNVDRLAPAQKSFFGRYLLLGHCTERTNASEAFRLWARIFAKLGVDLNVAEIGCCGMAGTFGHEVRNRALSQEIYAMSWPAALDGAGTDTVLMATGYSCRSQAALLSKRKMLHPVQALNMLINGNPPGLPVA
ncbi:FAD-binding and (Fe-S)-binding domain-containing protein [Mesorhizobium sp.]|uniref:D-2-hydroxyglutarate dehydrogenase YdiJ n=1 Tax=Mesorhizobium sp. TaxID=1871066 RepID=UPI0025F54937|nr:FAD-binding and (Fe-S)-binding domain-containing protein [Mesorhizobium sp.]